MRINKYVGATSTKGREKGVYRINIVSLDLGCYLLEIVKLKEWGGDEHERVILRLRLSKSQWELLVESMAKGRTP